MKKYIAHWIFYHWYGKQRLDTILGWQMEGSKLTKKIQEELYFLAELESIVLGK